MSNAATKNASGTLLILGGTAEAAEVARLAVARFGNRQRVLTSLAGRTAAPRAIAGDLRVGGFGGAAGLAEYLRRENVRLVVDALHPFAATMAGNAVQACAETATPRLALRRAPWTAQAGDRWIEVPDAAAAARALRERGVTRAFLASGQKDAAAFAGLPGIWFLMRLVEPPDAPLPLERHELILARGPFDAASDEALLRRHAIEAVVSKNSGGKASVAKIAAARALNIPVIMIAPPAPPLGELVRNVGDAVAWIGKQAV
ncbi:MAG: cobalt-precorrin-6A reductase [Alphaproteobacteria bacterium]